MQKTLFDDEQKRLPVKIANKSHSNKKGINLIDFVKVNIISYEHVVKEFLVHKTDSTEILKEWKNWETPNENEFVEYIKQKYQLYDFDTIELNFSNNKQRNLFEKNNR